MQSLMFLSVNMEMEMENGLLGEDKNAIQGLFSKNIELKVCTPCPIKHEASLRHLYY